MLEFGTKNVDLTSVLKDDLVVEVEKCFLSRIYLYVFYKCFPNFCFLKDKNFDDSSVGAEQLVKIVMGNHVTKLVIDAYQQHRALRGLIIPIPHYSNNN